jgi:transcriptional regulator with XRE-family HTH domain
VIEKLTIRIGDKIKLIRKEKQLSLTQLAALSGVQLATLSRIEHNKMCGTLESHARISIALKIPLSELYSDVKLEFINL